MGSISLESEPKEIEYLDSNNKTQFKLEDVKTNIFYTDLKWSCNQKQTLISNENDNSTLRSKLSAYGITSEAKVMSVNATLNDTILTKDTGILLTKCIYELPENILNVY